MREEKPTWKRVQQRTQQRETKKMEKKLKSDAQKELIRQFIILNQGSRTHDIMALLNVCHRRASKLLMELTGLGKLFRTGATYTVRYWSSEAASKDVNAPKIILTEKELEMRKNVTIKNMKKRSDMPGMVFLCEKRPKSINTVFEQCKKSCEQSLMVYRVMAGVK